MAVTMITVTGVLLDGAGNPATGKVRASLPVSLTNGGEVIEAGLSRAQITGDGSLVAAPEFDQQANYGSWPYPRAGGPFVLAATDDPGTTPVGVAYVFELDQGARDQGDVVPSQFSAIVPHLAAGGTISIGQLAASAIPAPAPVDYTPSVSDVALLLGSRTVDSSGNDVGTFTTETRPTAVQVAALAVAAVADLQSRLGTEVPPELAGEARRLSALQAACLVEASMYAEAESSARVQYAAQYLQGSATLAELLHGVAVRLR
jgi:hypothetical protein